MKHLLLSFQRFMLGRYGTDCLSRHLIVLSLIGSFANILLQSLLLYVLNLVICLTVFFRMFSKKTEQRSRENAAYERFLQTQKGGFNRLTVRIRQRKTSRFFRCPHCRAPIKMPRKIGKFQIRCGKCSQTFTKEFKK